MYKVKVNEKYNFEIEAGNKELKIDNEELQIDIAALSPGRSHILYQGKSYNVEIISQDRTEKTTEVKVNGRLYRVTIEDRFDQLLKQLGMDNLSSQKVQEIKAPMPGLVLKVLVTEGQEVKKGDNLLVLEAMKMENIIKSSTDGVVKNVKVAQGDKVEKNAVLLQFN